MNPPNTSSIVTLRPVTKQTVRAVSLLKVSPDQERFVAPNAFSIAQAYFERDLAWFRGIYADDIPVGFVMVADDPAKAEYMLWRFMIDARYQGMGFGARALALVIAHIRTRPGATEFLTSYVPGEGCPGPFYARMGFTETGEMDEDERVMRLVL